MITWRAIVMIILISGCKTVRFTTTWKAEQHSTLAPGQVLVTVMIPGNDSLIRLQKETELVNMLTRWNYHALPAVKQFGSNGLSHLDQGEILTKLYGEGFRYILTMTLVPKMDEIQPQHERSIWYTADYYYQRIWSYKKLMSYPVIEGKYYLECIVFDLSQLQAAAVLRSSGFTQSETAQIPADALRLLVRKMVKEKLLIRADKNARQKPF
jgi:hypothetical protein